MAFIFQAEKKGYFQEASKPDSPGPGQYVAHKDYRYDRGYAPFLSTVERGIVKKPKELTPGPGSYDSTLTIQNSMKTKKAFYSTLSPDRSQQQEPADLSTAFKSQTKRFEYKIDTDQPGPGMYYKDTGMIKSKSVSSLRAKTQTELSADQGLQKQRTVIPSIPSYVHSYGYTESEPKKLTLNKNPLLEIQQFVGPGYYDIKDMTSQNTNKGTVWHKSSTKRFESQGTKLPTRNLGPGSYDATNLEGAQPKYKTKASSGFASTTQRHPFGKGKPKKSNNDKMINKANGQFSIEFDAARLSSVIMEGKGEEERMSDDSLPGPGQYYNEAIASSIKPQYKPTQLQFFGSGTERFRIDTVGAEPLGPGEYNIDRSLVKTASEKPIVLKSPVDKAKIKVPFQSTETRFNEVQPLTSGPGMYEAKNTIVERVNDRARRGYLGSFGSTEIRFREKKAKEVYNIENETAEQLRLQQKTLEKFSTDPEEDKKPAHYFRSKTTKGIIINKKLDEIPPPGTYDVNYFDVAKKVSQSESYFYTAKKAPFCSTETRFKSYTPQSQLGNTNTEELSLPGQLAITNNVIVRYNKKPIQTSVFASRTPRAATGMLRNELPGPGTYNSLQEKGWLKKSFNIKFLDDK